MTLVAVYRLTHKLLIDTLIDEKSISLAGSNTAVAHFLLILYIVNTLVWSYEDYSHLMELVVSDSYTLLSHLMTLCCRN